MSCEKKKNNSQKPYYIGLDIGTDSLGYAVTDKEYRLLKHKGDPMWGTLIFEESKDKSERRGFRTARRRLDRRQQRVHLLQEIFAPEIRKVDPRFFIRLQESSLWREDTSDPADRFILFNDPDLNIDWKIPTDKMILSEKDTKHPLLKDVTLNF